MAAWSRCCAQSAASRRSPPRSSAPRSSVRGNSRSPGPRPAARLGWGRAGALCARSRVRAEHRASRLGLASDSSPPPPRPAAPTQAPRTCTSRSTSSGTRATRPPARRPPPPSPRRSRTSLACSPRRSCCARAASGPPWRPTCSATCSACRTSEGWRPTRGRRCCWGQRRQASWGSSRRWAGSGRSSAATGRRCPPRELRSRGGGSGGHARPFGCGSPEPCCGGRRVVSFLTGSSQAASSVASAAFPAF